MRSSTALADKTSLPNKTAEGKRGKKPSVVAMVQFLPVTKSQSLGEHNFLLLLLLLVLLLVVVVVVFCHL